MSTHVTATFKTRTSAEDALRALEAAGINDDQISLIVTDSTRGDSFNMEENSKLEEGVAAGATAGGIVGAVLGALAAASTIAIPGLNIVVTGALASALAGLGAGAATGGLLGALVGAGIPEHEAKIYKNEIKNGSVLLAVKPENNDQKEMIKDIFEREDAYNLAA